MAWMGGGGGGNVARLLVRKSNKEVREFVRRPVEELRTLFMGDETLVRVVEEDYNSSLLELAVEEGNTELVHLLIRDYNFDPCVPSNIQRSVLTLFAAKGGQEELFSMLVFKYGMSAHEMSGVGATALHAAAHGGQTEMVRHLVYKHSLNVHARMGDGRNAAHAACSGGHEETWRVLVEEFDVDIGGVTSNGYNMAHAAAQGGLLEVLRLAVREHGMDPSRPMNNGWSLVHQAASYGHIEILRALRDEFGVDLSVRDHGGETGLHAAAKGNQCEAVRFFVEECGMSVLVRDAFLRTPLHLSCHRARIAASELLLQMARNIKNDEVGAAKATAEEDAGLEFEDVGPSVEASGESSGGVISEMSLECVSESNTLQVFETRKMGHWPVVIYAAETGDEQLMSMLLRNGAKQFLEAHPQTLTVAIRSGSNELVQLLLDAGMGPNRRDREDATPLHVAAVCGYADMVQTLLQFGADVDKRSKSMSVLHAAIQGGNTETVQVLLEAGAKLDSTGSVDDAECSTPLQYARKSGAYKVVRLLEDEHRKRHSRGPYRTLLLCRAAALDTPLHGFPPELLWEVRRWIGIVGWEEDKKEAAEHDHRDYDR